MGNSFRLISVFGFEIRIDYSWFVLFFLILWSFTAGVFPGSFPGLSSGTYLAMGAAATLLLFISLLLHELSHSLVARAKGIPVEGITLFLFGGVAQTAREPDSAGDEFLIAGVGPLSSLVLAGLFWLVGWYGDDVGLPLAFRGVAVYVAFLNLILALFNLLPGFPLDGGRLLRAGVWGATGNLTRATRVASLGGQAIAFLLMGWGIWAALNGDLVGGMWLVLIGWFVRGAAVGSFRQHLIQMTLAEVSAGEAMAPLESPVPVSQAPLPLEGAVRVAPRDTLVSVLHAMRRAEAKRALVVEEDLLVGVITAGELAFWLEKVRREHGSELSGNLMGRLVSRSRAMRSGGRSEHG